MVVDRRLPAVRRREERVAIRHVPRVFVVHSRPFPPVPRLHGFAVHRRAVAGVVVCIEACVIPLRCAIVFTALSAPVPGFLALLATAEGCSQKAGRFQAAD